MKDDSRKIAWSLTCVKLGVHACWSKFDLRGSVGEEPRSERNKITKQDYAPCESAMAHSLCRRSHMREKEKRWNAEELYGIVSILGDETSYNLKGL